MDFCNFFSLWIFCTHFFYLGFIFIFSPLFYSILGSIVSMLYKKLSYKVLLDWIFLSEYVPRAISDLFRIKAELICRIFWQMLDPIWESLEFWKDGDIYYSRSYIFYLFFLINVCLLYTDSLSLQMMWFLSFNQLLFCPNPLIGFKEKKHWFCLSISVFV